MKTFEEHRSESLFEKVKPTSEEETGTFQKKPMPVSCFKTSRVLKIPTLEGEVEASIGSWVCTGYKGEQWPIAADIFNKTYKRVEAK